MESVASRYANALYSLALETNAILSYKEEVRSISNLLDENEEFENVLGSTFLSKKERNEMVDKVFSNKIDENIVKFLKIIVENNRATSIRKICKEFNSLCNKSLNIEEGIVYSSSPLAKDEVKKIMEVISKKENKKVELVNKVNPSLLGGVKVIIHDRIYDGSLLARIDSLKKNLLEKGGHK